MFLFPRAAHKIRVPAKHADGPVKLQRVRILKSRPRSVVLTVLALPLTIVLLETSEYWLPDDYKKVLQSTRAKSEEEKKKNKNVSSQHGGSKEKSSPESRMIGITGVGSTASRKLPRPEDVSFVLRLPYIRQQHPLAYKKTDKEWMEATKLMDDPARLVALKKTIVQETLRGWARDKPTLECIKEVIPGKASMAVQSIFDVIVPLYRPPKFEQYALVWLPGGPRLAKVQLSNTTASRILRIWYPEVSFKAFWNAGKVFTYTSYLVAKSHIRNLGSSGTSIPTLSSPASVHHGISISSPASANPGPSTDKSLDTAEKTDDPLLASFFHLAKTLTPETPLAQAKLAFLVTSSALQIQKLQYVPEGAVVFRGYVSFVGLRGKVKSNVSAIYLPAQDRLILPVIIEDTEILPNTKRWHQVDSKKRRMQSGEMSASGVASTTAHLQASVDQRAKSLTEHQRSMETMFAAETVRMEEERKRLARDVQKLDEMGGKASPNAKIQSTSSFHYTKKEGPGRVAEVLETLLSEDPHLKKLVEEIASGKWSQARFKEFDAYVEKTKSIILAQEIESRHGGQRLSEDRPDSSLVSVEKEEGAKKVEDMNFAEDKKIGEGEKGASDSIEKD